MTQEKHQEPFEGSKLTEEVPVMRRSRSLSELPGNIRVPILRRGDTERTQARLEAGAAGVEELRALREQQQQIFDQTMAAVQQKRKSHTNHQRSSSSTADHHRLHYQPKLDLSKQQMHSCLSPLSAWHSTSSLTSISEELDSMSNNSANKHYIANSIKVPDSSLDQKKSSNTSANKNVRKTSNSASDGSRHHKLIGYPTDDLNQESGYNTLIHDPQKQHHCTVLNHPQEKKFKSSIIKAENISQTDEKKMAQVDELAFKNAKSKCSFYDDNEGCSPSIQDIQTRSRTTSQDNNYYREHKKYHNPTTLYQRQQIPGSQSKNDSRGRSQSVHDNFLHLSDVKENNCNSNLGHQNGVNNHMIHNQSNNYQALHLNNIAHLQDPKSIAGTNYVDWHTTAGANTNDSEHKHACSNTRCRTQSMLHTKTTPSHLMPSFSLQTRVKSKSISWDNLLVVIGIQEGSSTSASEIIEDDQESNDEVFVNIGNPAACIEETGQSAEKKMRSQSFTAGCSLKPGSKSGFLKKEEPYLSSNRKQESGHSETTQRYLNGHQRQVTNEWHSTSLLRRASIQCEAVLTQTGTPRKIINPLQDVDISSLQSPGPLHAVTLQYSNIPLKKTDKADSNTIMASSSLPASEEKHTLPSKHDSNSFQPITQSLSFTATSNAVQFIHEKCRAAMIEPCHSKVDLGNSQKEHPIPRPRKSIKVSQEVFQQAGSDTTRENNKLLNETAEQKQNYIKSKKNILQITDASGLFMSNSESYISETKKETVALEGTKNILYVKSAIEHEDLFSKSQNKSITSKISNSKIPQNSELSYSERESQNKLSVKIYCSSNDKTTSNINDDADSKRGLCEKVNKTIVPQTPSFSDKHHFTDGTSQIQSNTAQAKNNGKIMPSLFMPQKHILHTLDISILSDEGYRTSESISQQSQLDTHGHSQSCDMSYVSSGSVTSMSFVRDSNCSSDICDHGFQKNCRQSNMDLFDFAKSKVKDELNSENNSHSQYLKAKPKTATNSVTEGVTGEKSQFNDKPVNTVLSDPALYQVSMNRRTSLNNNFIFKDKQAIVDISELDNQKTRSEEDDFAASYDNTCTKNSKDDHNNSNVVQSKGSRQICKQIIPAAKQSTDSLKNSDNAVMQSFRQTSV